ncbi:beta-glucosidase [Halanaerobium saccharolyticum]|uniref:Beta-glucosidase n=1 Tax=Halanaerobium saccharolyticum TaxID=43595 RepID=A0A4R7Z0A3_9FIRM|nr:glycoside hydrolase family 3 C-terminal domain-containing protein [Halanaerobium saccharolyticum]RAK07169.1 beta-glucosidase [Halanaerobium saccharolyticum]TDW02082.1 beta-glucosidase [Halanaerobium saccharolyticum]TDX58813.1 beta-glucosidase [Halanaerobium saccharolyticum]
MTEENKYKNPDLPLEERVDDLLSKMTLEEKMSQMIYDAAAVERLDIKKYNWWNECLHGVARAGTATVFPQAIGMAASFSEELLHDVADTIADEARAKYNEAQKHNDRGIYKGLTFWTPNINIFRDPRWGRGQETYGEDPYLTGRLGVAFIEGLQGDHPKYLKAAACAKHFAVHSGPESERHHFDAVVNKKDLRETYLPAFRDAVKEADVEAVMGAYNRVNGEPACASEELMENILRGEWEFDGHYVSDCGAIEDIYVRHKVQDSPEAAAAMAVNKGCDLNCGRVYESMKIAVEEGLLDEETIDKSVKRLMKTRFKLGMFDAEAEVPFNKIPYQVNDSKENRELARETARQSIVMLKNKDSILPLAKNELDSIAVIGPNADSQPVLIGNYSGKASKYVTLVDGIHNAVNDNTRVYYAEGCDLRTTEPSYWGNQPDAGFAEAVTAAEKSDVVVICLGISPELEGEEGAVANSDGGGDKIDLKLPGMQEELLAAVAETGKPIIAVITNGSPVELNSVTEKAEAVLEAWYPGQEGGNAVADILFGDYNPSAKLPVTFVKSMDQLPDFRDYSMQNRTYRFMEEDPLYPFGFGLSYTDFEYSGLELSQTEFNSDFSGETKVKVKIKNTGDTAGKEVAQLYLRDLEASVPVAKYELRGVKALDLAAGEEKEVEFNLTPRDFALIDNDGQAVLETGKFKIFVGGSQPDQYSQILNDQKVLSAEIKVKGEDLKLEY